jgi:RNA polymerase sigma-70 factor, ECF subfamily
MRLPRTFASVVSELRQGLESKAVVLSHEQINEPHFPVTQTSSDNSFSRSISQTSEGAFFSFDDEYLRRLSAHDPETESHFVSYFSERLELTLRARGVDPQTIDDVRQETFSRVLVAVQAGSVSNPSAFGAYVQAVCKHVLSESRRRTVRNQYDQLEFPDVDTDIEEPLLRNKEYSKLVYEILRTLPARDRQILEARFFEERNATEVCEEFGISPNELRLLTHRASAKIRAKMQSSGE